MATPRCIVGCLTLITLHLLPSPRHCAAINSTLFPEESTSKEYPLFAGISTGQDNQESTSTNPLSTLATEEAFTQDVPSVAVSVTPAPYAPSPTDEAHSKCQSQCCCRLSPPALLHITCRTHDTAAIHSSFPHGLCQGTEAGSFGNDTWAEAIDEIQLHLPEGLVGKANDVSDLCLFPNVTMVTVAWDGDNLDNFPWPLLAHNCTEVPTKWRFLVQTPFSRLELDTVQFSDILVNPERSPSQNRGIKWKARVIGTNLPVNASFEFPIKSLCDHFPLQSLDLSHNSINYMKPNLSFESCQELEFLNISRSGLSEIPLNVLESVIGGRLVRLDLSDNSIEQIPSYTEAIEAPHERLTELNDSQNTVKALGAIPSWWSSLGRLRELDLRNNSISEIEMGVFTCHMKDLQHLDLSANQLNSLKACTFSDLISLRSLNISRNNLGPDLREVIWGSNCQVNTSASCPSSLTTASPPLLLEYDHKYTYTVWPYLRTIDMSHNGIVNIDNPIFRASVIKNLRTLLLDHNEIATLPHSALEHLPDLERLELQHNKLTWLDVGTFNNPKLVHLDLSYNKLHKIISMAFLYMPQIQFVDISYNHLSYIYKYAFYRICKYDQKVTMVMHHNELSEDTIWKLLSTFRHLENTKCEVNVDLQYNNITHFVSDVGLLQESYEKERDLKYFSSWNHVSFDLAFNPINCDCDLYDEVKLLSHIKFSVFPNETSFEMEFWKYLNCSAVDEFHDYSVPAVMDRMTCTVEDGRIHALHCPKHCVCQPANPNVQLAYDLGGQDIIVNCSGHQLDEVPAILPDSTIVTLDLSHNMIATFRPQHRQLENVTFIDLSHNALVVIEDGALLQFSRLSSLLLHDNRIYEIPKDIARLENLVHVTLYDNPLQCVCDDIKLVSQLINKSLMQTGNESSQARCASGQIVSERNLQQLCPAPSTHPAPYRLVIPAKSTHIYVFLLLGAVIIIALAGFAVLLVIWRRKKRMKLGWEETEGGQGQREKRKSGLSGLLVYTDKTWCSELERFLDGLRETCPALQSRLYQLPAKPDPDTLHDLHSRAEVNHFTLFVISDDLLQNLASYKSVLREFLRERRATSNTTLFLSFIPFKTVSYSFQEHLEITMSRISVFQHDEPEVYQRFIIRLEESMCSLDNDLDTDIDLQYREDSTLVPPHEPIRADALEKY